MRRQQPWPGRQSQGDSEVDANFYALEYVDQLKFLRDGLKDLIRKTTQHAFFKKENAETGDYSAANRRLRP